MQGHYLDTLTWPEAEALLNARPTVLLPVGARCKEHGYHLPLNTDWLTAEYLTAQILERCPVLALPTLPYGYYPAFVDYPGSITLSRSTFQNLVCDICHSLQRHGAQRFYLLNTGISTNWALEPARLALQESGILMDYTDLTVLLSDVVGRLSAQPCGSHADEIETSKLLYIRPEVVKLDLARPELNPRRGGARLTRDAGATEGIYSPTGAWGDPTLATREKGEILVKVLIERVVEAIERLSRPEAVPAPARTRYLTPG